MGLYDLDDVVAGGTAQVGDEVTDQQIKDLLDGAGLHLALQPRRACRPS